MITQAKANASAVKAFEQSVSAIRDYSSRLDKGILCLETLLEILCKADKSLNDAIAKMAQAINRLSAKIAQIERQISTLNARLEQLSDRLDSLETKLEHTQEHGDIPGEEIVSEKISRVHGEMSFIQDELSSLEQRLDQINAIYSHLESHADAMKGVEYSVSEKKNTCHHLLDELETVQQKNMRQGVSASETLRKILSIIDQYLRIKMDYDEMPVKVADTGCAPKSDPGINIHIHESKVVQAAAIMEKITVVNGTGNSVEGQRPVIPSLSEQLIKEHGVVFNDSGRIVLYDGKTFGGEYNPYSARLKCTSVDNNPMLGHYEGERGESKFIPSNRTAEGIIITEILALYGQDGIIYRNAEPDFEVCAEAVVKIPAMSENRENYFNEDGNVAMGNFTQADMQLAEEWSKEAREGRSDWLPRDVYDYRKANRLTWHEKCDTKTMVLVRFEINLFFKHSGGCSECRVRDSVTDNGGGFDE